MNAKHLILTLSLALAGTAAVAAIKHGQVEPTQATPAAQSTAIPRVVVTASRAQAKALADCDEAPVARVVVIAPRHDEAPVAREVVTAPRHTAG